MIKWLKGKYIEYRGWTKLKSYNVYYQHSAGIIYLLPFDVLHRCSWFKFNDLRATFLLSEAESYCILSLMKDKFNTDVYESLAKKIGEKINEKL
jgi:hypothetical protein